LLWRRMDPLLIRDFEHSQFKVGMRLPPKPVADVPHTVAAPADAAAHKAAHGAPHKKAHKDTEAAAAPSMIETGSVKGTRDWPPELMRQRNWLWGLWRETARKFAFDEYDAPILEEESLYKRKAGEEISEQIYNFVTKDDTKVSLRPEMTPSLARLVLQKGKAMILPARWYTICQCWRFESIQKGRKREHYQWNMDIIGCKFVTAEAELIAAMVDFFKATGLTSKDVVIKVNSRKILQRVLTAQGIEGDLFGKVCVIVDKLEKIEKAVVQEELELLGLPAATAAKVIKILSSGTLADVRAELEEGDEYVKEIEQFFEMMDAYGCGDWVVFTPSVVRGLVYYTGIVFEGFDRKGGRAICGGGRYDELLTKFGAPQPIPCCGFGFGDCVMMDVLNDRKLVPALPPTVQDIVIPWNESLRNEAVQVATRLRTAGRRVDVVLDARRVKNAFSYADRIGADRAIFVAPEEWKAGEVKVKDLRKAEGEEGREVSVKIADLC